MRMCEGTPNLVRLSWIFCRCGMSESLPAKMPTQQPLMSFFETRFMSSLLGGVRGEAGNSKVCPVILSNTLMYRYTHSTTCSSVSVGTALPGLKPCSSSTSLTYCLENSFTLSSGLAASSSLTSLYCPPFMASTICGHLVSSSLASHRRLLSGVLTSSMTCSLPLSSVPNSYLVSMSTRPRLAASSWPLAKSLREMSLACCARSLPMRASTSW
mmetsp:Transcript_27582/g.68757  ORF Transcript_27582/g.68757 Transcript_27582/m.68757 type:complete len:213 (-) Transcript_27582:667-1305(-)